MHAHFAASTLLSESDQEMEDYSNTQDAFHPLFLCCEDLPTSFQSSRCQSSDAVLVTCPAVTKCLMKQLSEESVSLAHSLRYSQSRVTLKLGAATIRKKRKMKACALLAFSFLFNLAHGMVPPTMGRSSQLFNPIYTTLTDKPRGLFLGDFRS